MKHIDKKLLGGSAALLLLAALPVVAARAQPRGDATNGDTYKVVINHEEQYSIWPAGQEVSGRWRETRKTGSLKECMAYIEEVWTDMRPLSLRKRVEEKDLAKGRTPYKVVVNHEEQYSIWLVDQEESGRWRETGKTGSFKECMTYIEEVWTDMRPLSLRKGKDRQ